MEEMVDVANITDQQMERLEKEGYVRLTDREVYDQQLDGQLKRVNQAGISVH